MNISATFALLIGLVVAIAGVVLIALFGTSSPEGLDAELSKALSYAVIGLTGGLAGVAKGGTAE